MIRALYEKLTGRPWTTTRSMSAEYGPPPGAVYAHQLAAYTDAELIVNGDRILAALREQETITACSSTVSGSRPIRTGRSGRPAAAPSESWSMRVTRKAATFTGWSTVDEPVTTP